MLLLATGIVCPVRQIYVAGCGHCCSVKKLYIVIVVCEFAEIVCNHGFLKEI